MLLAYDATTETQIRGLQLRFSSSSKLIIATPPAIDLDFARLAGFPTA